MKDPVIFGSVIQIVENTKKAPSSLIKKAIINNANKQNIRIINQSNQDYRRTMEQNKPKLTK